MDQETLKKLVLRRHPSYDALKAHWDFLESTYRGGRAWFKENIHKYLKEGDGEFNDRVERAFRFNHTREVVELVNKYLFKGRVARSDDAPKELKDFWKRASRGGDSIEKLMKAVSRKTSISGRVAVVVDTTNRGEAVSKADEKRLGAQVYGYPVKTQSVLDYAFDDMGLLRWVLLFEPARDDDDPFTSSGGFKERYRLWTREAWQLFEVTRKEDGNAIKEVMLIDADAHGLGEVPVVLVDHVESDEPYAVPSLIGDIAYLDRAVANYLSNLDAIIQDQTFSQLAMPAQGIMPGDSDYNKLVEAGTKRIFVYDGEHGGQPFFLSPDPKQAELIVGVINKIIAEIYHSIGMAGERTKQDNTVGIDNSSGVAKAYDFERVNALLAAKAAALQGAENKIARLVLKWHGKEVDLGETFVTYPDNFDVRSLYDEFEIAGQLSLLNAPDTMRREQMKQVIDKLWPQLSTELRSKMEEELDDWPSDGEALGLPAGNRPSLISGQDSQQGQNNKEADEPPSKPSQAAE